MSATQAAATEATEAPPVSDKPDERIGLHKNNTAVMLVEIDCQVTQQPIPGGHIANLGVDRYRMYQGWLPVLLAQVRTDRDRSEYTRCKALYEQELQDFIDQHARTLTGVERELKIQECRDTFPQSPEGYFARDNRGRSLPPFERVTVIEENLPAPADEFATQRARETAELVASVIGKGNSGSSAGDVASAVAATIKQLIADGVLSVNTQPSALPQQSPNPQKK